MDAHADAQCVKSPKFEPLEPRLLLDAGGGGDLSASLGGLAAQPSPIVTPALEYESHGGPANDDPASAQELEFSYLLPKISPFDGFGPRQASVSGSADGSGGGEGYTGSTGRGAGRFIHPYSFDLTFKDTPVPGGGGTLTVQAFADLEGADKYVSLVAETIKLGDLFVEGVATNGWMRATVPLTRSQLATLADEGKMTFTVSPSPAVEDVGTGIILMSLTYSGGGGSGDFYRLDLGAGESASIALTSPDSGDLDLALFDAEGAGLATGESGAGGVAAAIEHFAAEEGGTFYVRVSGTGDYNLIVNRNATTDLEQNGDIESAQELSSAEVDGRQWVVGSASGTEGQADTDFYAVNLAPHALLKLQAYSPGVNGKGKAKGKGKGKGDSTVLQPTLCLYDSNRDLVAAGDGASLRYRAPRREGGTYYVAVGGAEGTGGDYILSVKAQRGPAQAAMRSQAYPEVGPASASRAAGSEAAQEPTPPAADAPVLPVAAAKAKKLGPKAAKPHSPGPDPAAAAHAHGLGVLPAADGAQDAGQTPECPDLDSLLLEPPALLNPLG